MVLLIYPISWQATRFRGFYRGIVETSAQAGRKWDSSLFIYTSSEGTQHFRMPVGTFKWNLWAITGSGSLKIIISAMKRSNLAERYSITLSLLDQETSCDMTGDSIL